MDSVRLSETTVALDVEQVPGSGSGPAARVSAIIRAADSVRAPAGNRSGAELVKNLPAGAPWFVHGSEAASIVSRLAAANGLDVSIVDTERLARICFPCAPDYGLESLLDHLGISPPPSGAAAVLVVRDRTIARILEFPVALLDEILRMLSARKSDHLRALFRGARAAVRAAEGEHAGPVLFENLFAQHSLPRPRGACRPEDARTPLDADETADLFGPAGVFVAALPGYEHREEQVEMARSVARAFSESNHLLVEAGTGTGKSLAYLVPALLWAETNNTPVVVSTNTKNLQSQLFERDLPLIARALDKQSRTALIKGRMNYLCVRKLLYLLRQAESELEPAERLLLPGVLVWAVSTRSGDLSENSLWEQAAAAGLAHKLACSSEECPGRACPRRKRCFLQRARGLAQAADIIVANHALVFAEMDLDSAVLPPYRQIVFDEAHNLEEAATRFFSAEVSTVRIRLALRRLWRRGRRRNGTGLIASVTGQLQAGAFGGSPEQRELGLQRTRQVTEAVEETAEPIGAFFDALQAVLDAERPAADSRPLGGGNELPPGWDAVLQARDCLCRALALVSEACRSLAQALRDLEDQSLPFQSEAVTGLDGASARISEITRDIEFVLGAAAEDYVFWIERVRSARSGARALGAPVRVGPLLHQKLYAAKDTVVFCSATLAVRGSNAFIKSRLGIDLVEPGRLAEMNAGSPFDYPRQCAVLVPLFLPDPGEKGRDYASELGDLLAQAFRRTRGRGMVLFTSYDMLRQTTRSLNDNLADGAVRVLAQGLSGTRDNITAMFRQDTQSVLMGTDSFWEGVDMVGETLSCLVVARLPFAVYTDPVVAARCDQVSREGRDPFTTYSVPNAVIRLRQGFGRLIRHRSDRGVVIVADRRILTRRYGHWFRGSLPAPTRGFHDPDAFLQAIEDALAAGQEP